MQPGYSRNTVIRNEQVGNGIYCLVIQGTFDVKPGQFYNLRAWGKEPLLPRPISIYDADSKSISFLYEVRRTGTQFFSMLSSGDEVELVGPLGNGFDLSEVKGKVALVTGGIGIAPMLLLAKRATDCIFDVYAGFRDESYSLDVFSGFTEKIAIATDSGREGHKGFVTDLLHPEQYDLILTCGPEIMMKKVATAAVDKGVPVLVSMEAHMACGIGACLVCTCKTVHGMKRTCKDGPIFRGEDVISC